MEFRTRGAAALLDMLVACWKILMALISEVLHRAQDKAHGRSAEVVIVYSSEAHAGQASEERRKSTA